MERCKSYFESMEYERVSINLPPEDINLLKSFHDNLSEAARIAFRKLRGQNKREELMKTLQIISFGILILGMSTLILPVTIFWIFFLFLGIGFTLVGIINLFIIARKKVAV